MFVATMASRSGGSGHCRSSDSSTDPVSQVSHLWLRYNRADNDQARLCAEKAIELDPTSARAHALLAYIRYVDYMAYWTSDRESAFHQAFELAQRAVLLDESDSFACVVLGFVQLQRRKFDQARSEIERAINLNPNDSWARGYYAFFHDPTRDRL
jgi:tetratricopeptide (TPR) repeat protein